MLKSFWNLTSEYAKFGDWRRDDIVYIRYGRCSRYIGAHEKLKLKLKGKERKSRFILDYLSYSLNLVRAPFWRPRVWWVPLSCWYFSYTPGRSNSIWTSELFIVLIFILVFCLMFAITWFQVERNKICHCKRQIETGCNVFDEKKYVGCVVFFADVRGLIEISPRMKI